MNGHFVVELRAAFKSELRTTSRRRPGRLLNVLCTFNFRPVSMGYCIILLCSKQIKKYLLLKLNELSFCC